MPAKATLIGERFGSLVVAGFSHNNRFGKACWVCVCDCGGSKAVITSALRSGTTRSCGCLRKITALRNTAFKPGHAMTSVTHGLSDTPEYRVWKSMVRRGTGKDSREWYAERGIVVCGRWRDSFESFIDDMGRRPTAKHSLDRQDNNGGYWCGKCHECIGRSWPSNCRWATAVEQRINQRPTTALTHNGVTMSISGWADHLGISQSAMSDRVAKWPLDRALTQPRRRQKNSVADSPSYRRQTRAGSQDWNLPAK